MPKFSENGYATCWKIYILTNGRNLEPQCFHVNGPVRAGIVKSSRQIQIAGKDRDDYCFWSRKVIDIARGIHVYTSQRDARKIFCDDCESFDRLVPVRVHKRDLVAVSLDYPEAVFMEVFLSKKDYDTATAL